MMMNSCVAAILRDGGIEPVYTVPVPLSLDPDPIVVTEGVLQAIDDIPDGRRLSSVCSVIVCRERLLDAEIIAKNCFVALDNCDWASNADLGYGELLRGVYVGDPQYKGRDKSGRWLYRLDVTLTIERVSANA